MGRKTSVKSRILRLAIISVAVVVTALLTVIAFLLNFAYNERYKSEAMHLATAYSQLIETNIDNLVYDLDTVKSNTYVVDESVPIEDRIAKLKELAVTSRFKDFAIAYEDGKTYNNTDISKREYFQQALKGDNYVSSPVIRMTDNSVTAMMAGSAFVNEGNKYVVYGGIDTMYFSQGFDTVDMGEGSSVFVMDKYGQIVASSKKNDVLSLENYMESEDEEMKRFATELIGNSEGYCYYSNGGTHFMAAYHDIPNTDSWTICVSANYDDITKAILLDLLIGIGIAVGLTILGIFISIAVANKVVRPIKNVNERLSLLADGDVDTIFKDDAPNDETGELSKSMLKMIRTLRAYITDIRDVLGALASGDLTVKSKIDYNGDFIEIGDALGKITSALNNSFSEVQSGMNDLRSGADVVAESAQSLSATAVEEAQAVDEISETVEKISRQADDTARISDEVTVLTRKTNDNAQRGGELMKELVAAVENIREKSDAISNIIKTISDIAFQTNILALNASVEASRAGEAGSGFAVVAGEVRSLATKSAEASQNTENLIKDSIKAVEEGTTLAARVSEEMNAIVADIDNVTAEIQRINSAAAEQKESISLINENIIKLQTGMSNTTATAEQNAASGEELTSLSSTLAASVSKYKTY